MSRQGDYPEEEGHDVDCPHCGKSFAYGGLVMDPGGSDSGGDFGGGSDSGSDGGGSMGESSGGMDSNSLGEDRSDFDVEKRKKKKREDFLDSLMRARGEG